MNKSKKILIVEDEEIIALDLKSSLEGYGYVVCGHITKGEEIISAIHQIKPDLILMDIKLEGEIDGVEAAQIIHDNYSIPVIFLTSYSNKVIIERAKKANPFGYIVKPFEDKELLTNIEIALFKHETEIKIKESEKKYRELSESIQQIIFECDKTGTINYVNEPGAQMLGINYSEIKKGIKITDFISEKNFEYITERINSGINFNALKVNREYALTSRIGKHIFIEEFVSPIYTNGLISGYRGILVDITSKKLKENLSFIYYKLTILFKEIEDDPLTIIKYLQSELHHLFFYIEDIYFNQNDVLNKQLIKHSITEIKVRAYSSGLTEYVIERSEPLYLRGVELDDFHKKNKLAIHGHKAACWTGFPLNYLGNNLGVFVIQSFRNENALTYSDFDNLNNFFISVQSFFDRISYLKRLKRSEEKYKNLVNSINEGLIQLDNRQKIIYVNRQFQEMTEYLNDELIGKDLFETFGLSEESVSILKQQIELRKKGFGNQYELLANTKSGKQKTFLINSSPNINETGTVIGSLATVIDLTETKKYQELIKVSEQKFKAIFDQAAVGVAITDGTTGYFSRFNDKFCEIIGYTREETVKMHFSQFTHPDDQVISQETFLKLTSGQIKELSLEKRYLSKTGKTIWANLTISKLGVDENGHVQFLSIIENINKRKQVERSLIASEQEKENILKSMPDSFVVFDINGNVMSSYLKNNTAFVKPEFRNEINGKKVSDIFVKQILKIIDKQKSCCLEKTCASIEQVEIKIIKDIYWFEIRLVPVNNEVLLLIARDITESKKNSIDIHKFFNIIEQTNELIMITDKRGAIEYINPMFSEVTGYTIKDIIGKRPSEFNSNKHNKAFFVDLWQTILSGNTFRAEFTNKKKNGELFIEEKVITPLKNKEGEITNFISTGRDITEEKKKERKILTYQKFEKTLEKKEQKYRTLSLIQGQENERKRLAREIHDGLGQMLTVASANLESLANKKLPINERKSKTELVNEMLSEIIQESRRISHNLSPVGLFEFGLKAVLTQFINRVNTNYEKVTVKFVSNLKSQRFKSEYEINLYRIIQEVIQNSLKHSKCSQIEIAIEYRNNVFKLEISDNGIGFNFNELENSNKHFNGIRNIQERAKIIDGKINFITKPKQGFKFDLTLKLKNKP